MKRASRNSASDRKMRRQKHWAVLLGTSLAASSVVGAQAAATPASAAGQGTQIAGNVAADTRVLSFQIPAGPLDSAIAAYERVTGLKVVLTNISIGTLASPGASGSLTPARAMEALLTGTSVRATFATGEVRLDLRPLSEVVDVEGRATKAESPKYTEPLRDTPQTLVSIPQQLFLEQNATSLREVLRNTPGITMSIGEGGSGGTSSGDNVLIRGFSARSDIYVNGVRDAGLVSRDMFDTQSVEVAKGPTGTTGGKGATGGSINLVSKMPSLVDAASIRVTGGSADYKRTTLDVNRKLNDTIGLRFNSMWQDAGYAGRDIAKNKSWGVAPSLALGLGKPTQVTVHYSHLQQNNIPDWGLPTLLPDVAIARGITVNDLNFSNFYGIASRDYEDVTSDLVTGMVEHRFSRTLSLRNLTRYGKNYRDAVLTPPRPATTAAGQGLGDPGYDPTVAQIRRTDTKYQHRDDRNVTNQTDLTSSFKTGFIDHSTDVGIELARDSQPTYAFTDLFTNGRPPVDDLFNPTPNVAYTPVYGKTGATTDAHATTMAGYAFDTIKLGDHWRTDLGLRFDHISVDYASVAAPTGTATSGVVSNFARVDNAVTGRAGLVYKPSEKGSIYAAYSTSFSPSFDGTLGLTLAATGVQSQALEPERSRNIEVGTKWEVRKELMLTAAVFNMRKLNAKTTDATGATVLAGDQRVNGVEFGLNGEITEDLNVFAGLSVMDGKVVASGVSTEVDQELAYVPHVTMNLWASYHLPKNLTVAGGADYNDGNYFNNTGGFLFVAGGTTPQTKYVANAAAVQALTKYWLFNAMATYSVNPHLQLQVNLTNIGNERYADRAYDRHFLPGPTRQVLFTPVITW